MMSSAFLVDPRVTLIVDSSVVIGLNASDFSRQIVELTPGRVVVADNISTELEIGARFGHGDAAHLESLIADGLIDRLPLPAPAAGIYEALIDGTYGETLDDGEAATIALAIGLRGVAVLDEKKARRICRARFPDVTQACTAQWILGVPGLAEDARREAILNALLKGRTRVPAEFIEPVVALIGPEAASSCPSLPRITRRSLPS